MDMPHLSKPPALQPGWIKSHQRAIVQLFCIACPHPLFSIVLVDGHDTLPANLKTRGAVKASVHFVAHFLNPRVADLVSDARHQNELIFKLGPGPIS